MILFSYISITFHASYSLLIITVLKDLSFCDLFIFQEHLSLKKYVIDIVVETPAPPEPSKDGEERQKNKKRAKKIKARMNSRYYLLPYRTKSKNKTNKQVKKL